ncbi:MAG: hypothetical protein AB7G13_13690 [Lautropia sp.]
MRISRLLLRWIAVLGGVAFGISVGSVQAQQGPAERTPMANPVKTPSVSRTPAAENASALMWSALHAGDYQAIEKVLPALNAAYLQDPNDATTAAHIGFLHVWRVSESGRLGRPDPTVLQNMAIARRFLEESVRLDGSDARYQGFRATARLAESAMHRDDALRQAGLVDMQDAVRAWPQFNLFTLARNLSGAPAGSPPFQQAIDALWQAQDLCVGGALPRENPDMAPFMKLETAAGPNRVCWNSWMAPHNFEGFFLEWGDYVVKSGDVQLARKIYANARLASSYATWPYRDRLEARVREAEANVARFNAPVGAPDHTPIGRSSPISCVACHQR